MKSILPHIDPELIILDFFCGFGGVTEGYVEAQLGGKRTALVIACVNHDAKAIASHWKNHPDVEHFEEDITKLYGKVINGHLYPSHQLIRLLRLVNLYRAFYPNAKVVLWASLECTNFSKAKGGLSRDADSRTLAHHLDRYIHVLQPDYIKIENVVEFMAWGPLKIKVVKDKNGYESCPVRCLKIKKPVEPDPIEELLRELKQAATKQPKKETRTKKKKTVTERFIAPHWIPESTKNGQYWLQWREHIRSLGYKDDWKQLNSADFGAYTSRNRLFGIFARPDLPIAWPHPTHAKEPNKVGWVRGKKAPTLFDDQPGRQPLQKWRAVRHVLNFTDQGETILDRKKPLSPNSLERIYAGLVRFIAHGDTSYLTKYFSGIHNISVDGPTGALTTIDHHAIVQPEFLVKYNSRDKNGRYIPPSLSDPCPVISTQGRLALGQPVFLTHYYSGGGELSSIDDPCPTVTAMDGKAKVHCQHFLDRQFGKSQHLTVAGPAGTLMPTEKHRLITAEPFLMPTNYDNQARSLDEPSPSIVASRRHHYLINPSWGGNPGSIDQPCCVIVARGDKAPLYLVQVEQGKVAIAVYEDDSPIMVKIKQFMAAYGLIDIKMRMLSVPELLRIQGFPDTYKMVGNQADKKKFIGNSVVPLIPKAWAEVLSDRLVEWRIAA